MPLLETTTLAIGTAIAKHMIKAWLGDGATSSAAQAALGPIQKRLAELLGQRREGDPIERVAQQVVENMQPIFTHEACNLDDPEREAVVLAVAETLTAAKLNARLLITHRLDPDQLTDALIAGDPDATALLSTDATVLYERLLRETSHSVVYIANNIDGYEPAFGHAVLFDLQEILDNLARMLAADDEEATAYEKAYCAALHRKLNQFEQFGIEYADEAGKQQQLDVAYVPLSAEELDFREPDDNNEFEVHQLKYRASFDEPHRSVRTAGSIDAILPLLPSTDHSRPARFGKEHAAALAGSARGQRRFQPLQPGPGRFG